jgi:hypothetical protein
MSQIPRLRAMKQKQDLSVGASLNAIVHRWQLGLQDETECKTGPSLGRCFAINA